MQRTLRTTVPTVGVLDAALGRQAGPAQADTGAPRAGLVVPDVSDGGPATETTAGGPGATGTPYATARPTRSGLAHSDRPTPDVVLRTDTADGRTKATRRTAVLPGGNPVATVPGRAHPGEPPGRTAFRGSGPTRLLPPAATATPEAATVPAPAPKVRRA
ncbi:hypothetical protein SAMN05428944_7232 [Streptomyces sp. 1222.5]|uniref:hypothetical protein n=1 Tax=unclassified Streptomyces TaxID=2593676 RepID=UPI000897E691|nr:MULTISPECIES: hypothetical protein [unclassified Streptomyces]PKW05739.1 hypothetical protein BX260_0860 [Streptomyces sp. 5112.2]SED30137.1 hypothetical protein SAMN05428944_7232 [Streptomyces sp. 1222.5]